MRIGLVGAGRVGRGLAKLAVDAGCDVTISNSRGPASLVGLAAQVGARAGKVQSAVEQSDVCVVAVPFTRVFGIDPYLFEGRTLIDVNNYHPERDGDIAALDLRQTTTSEMVQQHFRSAGVVKAFNVIPATDLSPPFGVAGRKRALPMAGDDAESLQLVACLHELLGLDVVNAGRLAESWRFERGEPAYCTPLDEAGLRVALAQAQRAVAFCDDYWGND